MRGKLNRNEKVKLSNGIFYMKVHKKMLICKPMSLFSAWPFKELHSCQLNKKK